MTKANILSLIEDILDSATLPLNEYCVTVYRENSNYEFHIHRRNISGCHEIDDMAELSEIFNNYSEGWMVYKCDEKQIITLKIVVS